MADSDRGVLVDEFCKVTGVEAERARLYLEAAGWNSDLAMSTYYEEGDDMDNIPSGDSHPDFVQPTPSASSSRLSPPLSVSVMESSTYISECNGIVNITFATLSSLIKENQNDDDEEGQAFYAGGSERSGQQVLGPGKRKSGSSIAEEMFKAARSHGAEVVDPSEVNMNKIQLKTFTGKGYVLGSTPETSDTVVSAPEAGAQQPVFICLRVYKSGFTVDDGPFRVYTDQENKEFLEAIKRGEVPRELREKARNAEVNLNIEDHSHEEYAPPKASSLQVFTGSGHRLGSPSPTVTVSSSPSECQKNEKEAQEVLKIDETQPVTNLQIRLADGSRLILKLNLGHTVGDIRRYLVTARPEYSASVFSLMTAYPTKELADDNATVKDENLLNAVIVQKLK